MRRMLISSALAAAFVALPSVAVSGTSAEPLLLPMETEAGIVFIPREELAVLDVQVDAASTEWFTLAVIYYELPPGYVLPQPPPQDANAFDDPRPGVDELNWVNADDELPSVCSSDGSTCFGMECAQRARFYPLWKGYSSNPFSASCITFMGVSYTTPV